MDSTARANDSGAGFSGRVGWIGAGKMGAPMIRNLLRGGVPVAVTEPAEAALQALMRDGATDARLAAQDSGPDVVFATLPNDRALLDVVLGTASNAGLAATLPAGTVFVEMSTVSPNCSRTVAQALGKAQISYLRAPISGSTAMAEAASLTLFASGDLAAWDTALPLLEMISTKRFYLGPDEQARYMKLVVNTLVGATSAVLAEALALGTSGGLTRADMMEVICQSAVASPLLGYKREAVVADDFAAAFTVTQMIKDFTLISDTAREHGVPLLTTGLILELYRTAANAGLRDEDFFALVKWHAGLSAT